MRVLKDNPFNLSLSKASWRQGSWRLQDRTPVRSLLFLILIGFSSLFHRLKLATLVIVYTWNLLLWRWTSIIHRWLSLFLFHFFIANFNVSSIRVPQKQEVKSWKTGIQTGQIIHVKQKRVDPTLVPAKRLRKIEHFWSFYHTSNCFFFGIDLSWPITPLMLIQRKSF